MDELKIGNPVAKIPGRNFRHDWEPVVQACKANPGLWVPLLFKSRELACKARGNVSCSMRRATGAFSGPGWSLCQRGCEVFIRWAPDETTEATK